MTEHLSEAELMGIWNEYERPKIGEIYEHYKGGMYKIVSTGFFENDETPCIVYQSLENEIIWVRSVQNFFEEMMLNDRHQPRFKLVHSQIVSNM